jgi:hypothetical protein
MRVRSSIAEEYTSALKCGLMARSKIQISPNAESAELLPLCASCTSTTTTRLLPAGECPSFPQPLPSFPRKRESTAPGALHLQPQATFRIMYQQVQAPDSTICTQHMPPDRCIGFRKPPLLHLLRNLCRAEAMNSAPCRWALGSKVSQWCNLLLWIIVIDCDSGYRKP